MQRFHVYIDPDGSIADGLLIIVAAPTGVTYETQCGGLRCEQRRLEGFLVPCPPQAYDLDSNIEADLEAFFYRHFRNQGDPGHTWSLEVVDELAQLIHRVVCWLTPADAKYERKCLVLDRSRMTDCIEAWIPVLTPYGPGILTFGNSD